MRLAYKWRYTTLAVTIGATIVSVGLISGGRVDFQFFPSPESENISAEVEFAAGTCRKPIALPRLNGYEDALKTNGESA